jgi:NAD(P)H-flavin reductase/hemoglobin-like flavoprotein
VDTRLLRETFAAVAPQGPEVVDYFYAHLFATGGNDVIDMFPPLMAPQRDRLLAALVQIVTDVDDLPRLTEYLHELGRDHRKFGVRPGHFKLVGTSLLATLAYFAGESWTEEAARTWAAAYALVAQVMCEALTAEDGTPPWWDAVVTSAEMRSFDVAVLTVRLSQQMNWRPGQSVAVQLEDRPRIWRFYTPATVSSPDRATELHVKVIAGGLLSPALALTAAPGSRLRLGPPLGSLALDEDSGRDIVMVAGSTGLAPMLAMCQRLGQRQRPPRVALYFGAREPDGLYALERLAKLAAENDWLSVVHAASCPEEQAPDYDGERGNIVDVVARGGPWEDRDAYICGPSRMVQAAAGRLMALGMPGSRIHVEDFGWEG